ncbi:MAG: hypothetical protein QM774_00185 [Gordonia sp. (in: high G+C Gram-positive bacteria)]|uniref:hypothetical protein n=1 Tax=Gordonia sp. (in: high G+C Gram-positive bacteria) TaxID=84139 RepID=UPI0039E23AEC
MLEVVAILVVVTGVLALAVYGLARWETARARQRLQRQRLAELARVRHTQRQAEAQISHITQQALHAMAMAAVPHGVLCQCMRCTGRSPSTGDQR